MTEALSPKLKAKLPKENSLNGLDWHLGQKLIAEPDRQHVIVAYVSVAQIITDRHEDREIHTPVLQVDAIEWLGDTLDVSDAVANAFTARHMRRMDDGQATLTGGMDGDNYIDPATGEVRPIYGTLEDDQ